MVQTVNGMVIIDRYDSNCNQEDINWFNVMHGENKWKFRERFCSYLEPSCGYGAPLNEGSCAFCNGHCIRPTLVALSK